MKTLKRQLFLVLIIFNLFVVGRSAYAQDKPDNFDSGITELSRWLAVDAHSYKNLSVAVLEFNNLDGKNSDFSKLLSEELTTKLFQTKKFNVIERSQIVKIIKEQKLQLTGPIDNASIKMLGKLTGVSSIITGSITDMQSYLRINARLISISTGSIISARSVNILKDETMEAFLNSSVTSNLKNKIVINNYSERQIQSKTVNTTENNLTFKLVNMKISKKDVLCEILITSMKGKARVLLGDYQDEGMTRLCSKSNKFYTSSEIYMDDEPHGKYCINSFFEGISQLVYFRFKNAAEDFSNLYLIAIHHTDNYFNKGVVTKMYIEQ